MPRPPRRADSQAQADSAAVPLSGAPLATTVVTTPAERRLAFRVLFLAVLAQGMGQPIMFTILPPVARELGLSEWQTGMIFMISAVLWVALSPYWGRLSDRWARKPVMLIGLVAFSFSTLLFTCFVWVGLQGLYPLWVVYTLMICSRCIFGSIGPGTPAAAQAYIADRTTRLERTSGVSTLAAGFGLGAMLGPGVGASLAVLGLLAPLFAVAGLAFVGAALIYFFLPERTPPRVRRALPKLKVTDLRVRPFLMFGLLTGTAQAIPIQAFTFFLMDTLNLSAQEVPQQAGVALMCSAASGLFAQLYLVQHLKLKAGMLMRWGTGLAIGGMVLLIVSDQLAPITLGLVFLGLGFGMNRPGYVAAASLAVRPDEQGAAAGLINSAGAMGFVLAPLIGLPLYEIAPVAPFVLALVLLGAAAVYVQVAPSFRLVDTEPRDSDTIDPSQTPV
ncbi:MAG: MFS transporter [Alphaproteobacteria bacterium]|nr:MFS transporter [Alphaproteobacteria bacterium]